MQELNFVKDRLTPPTICPVWGQQFIMDASGEVNCWLLLSHPNTGDLFEADVENCIVATSEDWAQQQKRLTSLAVQTMRSGDVRD